MLQALPPERPSSTPEGAFLCLVRTVLYRNDTHLLANIVVHALRSVRLAAAGFKCLS